VISKHIETEEDHRERPRNIEEEYPPRAGNTQLTIEVGKPPYQTTFTFSSPHHAFMRQLNNVLMVTPELIARISPETPEVYAGTQNITRKASNYTATPSDYMILCDASAGAFTISLPSAINGGLTLIICKVDSSGNSVQLAPFGNDTLQGQASKSLDTQWQKIILTADGVSCWVVETENLV
jgi:hypothetical protein